MDTVELIEKLEDALHVEEWQLIQELIEELSLEENDIGSWEEE
jgi:hypothetical protein|tara:strand:- start:694 stop:822 length:129 start_codon:yes stop_codon:yes gene_type:complete